VDGWVAARRIRRLLGQGRIRDADVGYTYFLLFLPRAENVSKNANYVPFFAIFAGLKTSEYLS
jgi:hypothetical protein